MSGDHNAHQNDFKPDWDTVKTFDDRYNEDTELLRQCLEALEYIPQSGSMLGLQAESKRLQAITALKERLK